ncbi:unnamed protein product [Medioppia subpectinata]|uniref:Uncharacterized protein n=1 Tax=Medioppia subpectinata TaxID=1979941 RepID=A0A7R9KFP5_9ACAR|nr:unnamed protein product [Medioppia subpectinata]CAG2101720.1 unnamed protein product [Medioppia subpectinata]
MKSSFNTSNGYNHYNSNYLTFIESHQKTDSSHERQSQSNCRTPIAWHNRSLNLSQPLSLVQSPVNYPTKYRRPSAQRSSQRPSSPSATTTSSDDREEVPMVRHHIRRPNSRVTTSSAMTVDNRRPQHMIANKYGNHMMSAMISGEYSVPMHTFRNGTLRSTKSVPALAMATTMGGDSCPVHGLGGHSNGLLMHACHPYYPSIPTQTLNFRRFGSISDMRETRLPIISNGLSYLAPIPENKQTCALMPVYYSQSQSPLSALPAPNNNIPLQLMQQKAHPMHTTRPMIFPAYAEPLPFRSPFKVSSPVPSHHTIKMGDNYGNNSDDICCRGHLIVLWIILGIVTVGVISGIILAVTLN